MKELTASNFGLLVAYLLPGFVGVLGIAVYSETIRTWLASGNGSGPTVGGFLYLTLASLTAGLVISTIRWAVVDQVHHATGVHPPAWDFRRLQERLGAFELLVESHYRYYQFYANMFVAVAIAYVVWRIQEGRRSVEFDLGVLVLECVLFLGSRDTLSKYYRRVGQLMSERGSQSVPAEPHSAADGISTRGWS